MGQLLERRQWIRQAALAIGGMTIAGRLSARDNHPFQFDPSPIIRLNANENPYGPSPLAKKAMAEAINASNRYPWDVTTQLREKIASKYGLKQDNILMGAGSSEILGVVALYAGLQKGNAVTADPTFGIWFTLAQKTGLELIKVPLTADKKHDLGRMKKAINPQTRLVYVCNPNNPTGTILPHDELKTFVRDASSSAVVLLDEAYIEYSDEVSLAGLVKDNPNLIIAKTFSKIHGMAGARIGYAIGHQSTIAKLGDLQPWINAGASAVSLAGANASLDDSSFLAASKARNKEAGKIATDAFQTYGVDYIPSHTNFLYYSLKNQKKDLLSLLGTNNIRGGRITEENGKWSRITIGTPGDMNRFVEIIKQSFTS